jgi:hypothetical protein
VTYAIDQNNVDFPFILVIIKLRILLILYIVTYGGDITLTLIMAATIFLRLLMIIRVEHGYTY